MHILRASLMQIPGISKIRMSQFNLPGVGDKDTLMGRLARANPQANLAAGNRALSKHVNPVGCWICAVQNGCAGHTGIAANS